MNCPDFEGPIALYVGDDLPESEVAAVVAHLRECAACRTFAEELSGCHMIVQSLRQVEIPPARVDELRRDLVERFSARRRGWRFLTALFQPGWATAVLFVIAAGIALGVVLLPVNTVEEAARTFDPPPAARVEPGVPAPDETAPSQPKPKFHPISHSPRRRTSPAKVQMTKEDAQVTARVAPEPQRLEIQTADPNVRIIWFVQPTAEKTNGR
jgi:Putative zinc-finger